MYEKDLVDGSMDWLVVIRSWRAGICLEIVRIIEVALPRALGRFPLMYYQLLDHTTAYANGIPLAARAYSYWR